MPRYPRDPFTTPNSSENTATPAAMQVVVRIHYIRTGEDQYSHMWARVPAHASNILAVPHTVVEEGEIISGITTPTFGDHLAAVFNTWRVVDLRKWHDESDLRRGKFPIPLPAQKNTFGWAWGGGGGGGSRYSRMSFYLTSVNPPF